MVLESFNPCLSTFAYKFFTAMVKLQVPTLRVLQPQLWDSNVGMTIVHLQIFTSHHRPTQATPSVPTSTHCDSLFTLKTPLPSCRPCKSPSDLKLVRLAFIEPTYIYIYIYVFLGPHMMSQTPTFTKPKNKST